MEIQEIKWLTLDNYDDTRTLKQHGFIPKLYLAVRDTPFNGNISLCRKVVAGDDNEDPVEFSVLEEEPLDRSRVCKRCLKMSGL